MRPLPERVYLVQTEPGPRDKRRYYGPRRFERLYRNLAQAELFIKSNSHRKFRLLVAEVTWKEIRASDVDT